jgi:DNA processing protein
MVPGVGPRVRKALVERFGSAADVLAAAISDLRSVPGVGTKLCRAIAAARREIDVAAELELCRQNGVGLLVASQPEYPQQLRTIYDPPGVLFVRGQVLPVDGLAVAIVGTRHATPYGLAQAERLAGGLARAGYTIVSGLARGIDAAAHRGALKAGGRTLAVLGRGVLNIYPPEHVQLADEVIAHGAVLSENPPRSEPFAGAFPQRNRIVTGLSQGVIVVEAADRSGALISARHAMEQSRDVFAVPGRVDSRMSKGCHRLIRDGAKLVETVDDVLEELGPLAAPNQAAASATGESREIRHPV